MAAENIPLVVDLDGTLTPTDTLMESVLRLIKQSPLHLIYLLLNLLKGRVPFKSYVAINSTFSPDEIPYRKKFIAYLKIEKRKGRKIILATASHITFAKKVSDYLCLFDDVIATNGKINLKGKNKLQAIKRIVGDSFSYAGDSDVDIPVWREAKAAVLVGVSQSTVKKLDENIPIEAEFEKDKVGFETWIKMLRIGKWLKNVMLFTLMLTAFSCLDLERIVTVIIAFLSFSVSASAIYIINDLWNLENDRRHPKKRDKVLATATVPITTAVIISVVFINIGLMLAMLVSNSLLVMLILYMIVSISYNCSHKKNIIIDSVALSVLFTIKIIAITITIDVPISS